MDLAKKLIFSWRKPQIVIVPGETGKTPEIICQILKQNFKVGFFEGEPSFSDISSKEVLIFRNWRDNMDYFAKHSRQLTLVAIQPGASAADVVKKLRPKDCLILNFDDIEARNLKKDAVSDLLTFGFYEGADVRASDINLGVEEAGSESYPRANFKLNYKGGFVPVWLNLPLQSDSEERELIFPILAAAAVGIVFGLNLIEISERLRTFSSLV